MFRTINNVGKLLKTSKFSVRYCSSWTSSASNVQVDFAKDRYDVKRGKYSEITDSDIAKFESILGSNRVITDASETSGYNVDFLKAVRGYSNVVLKPKTTEEVAELLKYCNQRKLAVCPQSGNTGLVGGSVPIFDECIISLTSMNQIEYIDEYSGILVCQSGCVLEKLDEEAQEKGLCMPLDLGAKGSCLIGGNVSTNAGGIRLIRYGNLHGSVLGVEAVTAEGKILNLMSNFKKDNTGYHLKHLFIGSEGTLGIVTKVAIQCATKPKAVSVAFLGLESYENVLDTFKEAKANLGEILSAVELIDDISLHCSTTVFNLRSPIEKYPFYMLIETSGSNAEHDESKLNQFLEKVMESNKVKDGFLTSEPGKIKEIWQIRERIADSLIKIDNYCFKYDISLPLKYYYSIVPATREVAGDLASFVCGYGHIGDSNIHLNIACKQFTQELYHLLNKFIFSYTQNVNGSISAEHGIGFLKPKYLHYSKDKEAILFMKQLKASMDPNGILNPYKVLPDNVN